MVPTSPGVATPPRNNKRKRTLPFSRPTSTLCNVSLLQQSLSADAASYTESSIKAQPCFCCSGEERDVLCGKHKNTLRQPEAWTYHP